MPDLNTKEINLRRNGLSLTIEQVKIYFKLNWPAPNDNTYKNQIFKHYMMIIQWVLNSIILDARRRIMKDFAKFNINGTNSGVPYPVSIPPQGCTD